MIDGFDAAAAAAFTHQSRCKCEPTQASISASHSGTIPVGHVSALGPRFACTQEGRQLPASD